MFGVVPQPQGVNLTHQALELNPVVRQRNRPVCTALIARRRRDDLRREDMGRHEARGYGHADYQSKQHACSLISRPVSSLSTPQIAKATTWLP